jgi:hypothetical protein
MFRRIGGVVVLVLGTFILAGLLYNVFVERLPEGRARNSPIAIVFVVPWF